MDSAQHGLFSAPKVVEHLGGLGWSASLLFAIVGLGVLLVASAILEGAPRAVRGISLGAGGAIFGFCILTMLRAIAPGIGLAWWAVVAPALLAAACAAWMGYRIAGQTSAAGWTLATGAGAVFLAILLDKANEFLGGVPIGWGVVLAAVGLLVLYIREN